MHTQTHTRTYTHTHTHTHAHTDIHTHTHSHTHTRTHAHTHIFIGQWKTEAQRDEHGVLALTDREKRFAKENKIMIIYNQYYNHVQKKILVMNMQMISCWRRSCHAYKKKPIFVNKQNQY
jgi:hypothetical protein